MIPPFQIEYDEAMAEEAASRAAEAEDDAMRRQTLPTDPMDATDRIETPPIRLVRSGCAMTLQYRAADGWRDVPVVGADDPSTIVHMEGAVETL